MYPCPKCGEDRSGLHAACVHCVWAPDVPEPEHKPKEAKPPFESGRSFKINNKAAILIGSGCCLCIAAACQLLIAYFFADGWALMMIAGSCQMLVGMACISFGIMANKRKPG